MTQAQQVQAFILRALSRTGSKPVTQEYLRGLIQGAFRHAEMTAADIDGHIIAAQDLDYISGTNHPLHGRLWLITGTGLIEAGQL